MATLSFCFLFFSLCRFFYISFSRDQRTCAFIEPFDRMVTETGDSAWDNQTLAFVFAFLLSSYLVFAWFPTCVCLACFSCYPYFDILLYAMFLCLSLHACHAYHIPFHCYICLLDVLGVFLFTNHVTTLVHAMHMPFDMMFDVYML